MRTEAEAECREDVGDHGDKTGTVIIGRFGNTVRDPTQRTFISWTCIYSEIDTYLQDIWINKYIFTKQIDRCAIIFGLCMSVYVNVHWVGPGTILTNRLIVLHHPRP